MDTALSVSEVAKKFLSCLNQVTYNGDTISLIRRKKKVAEIRPVSSGITLGELPAFFSSLPKLSSKEKNDFYCDILEIRKEINNEKLRNPWES